MDSTIIEIENIGKVLFKKSLKAKNLRITVKPFKNVVVSMPRGLSIKQAQNFVLQKQDWILKNFEKMREYEGKQNIFDESSIFRTREHELRINQHSQQSFKVRVKNGFIDFYYPQNLDIKSDTVQSAIKKAVESALRKEAKDYLPQRVEKLAKEHNLSYNKVFVKNQKSRWGSCSRVNNINLNMHLMRLPDELIDYVILHELAHCTEKNHGKNFWAKLNELTGSAKHYDKELKAYKIRLN